MGMRTRAAISSEIGQELIVEEVELRAPLAGEVLVEMKASGLCHTDLSVMEGNFPIELPAVLGHEGAGIVRECGPGVTGVVPGDHVILNNTAHCGECPPCLSGKTGLLPGHGNGRTGSIAVHLAGRKPAPLHAGGKLCSTQCHRRGSPDSL